VEDDVGRRTHGVVKADINMDKAAGAGRAIRVKADQAAELGEGFGDQNARDDRVAGEVALEEGFIAAERPEGLAAFAG
jgi:hypothetical protein